MKKQVGRFGIGALRLRRQRDRYRLRASPPFDNLRLSKKKKIEADEAH
jgi:hypothetical protein